MGGQPDRKLFAVYLGGRAPKCNTELHDVVFVTGSAIEDTYEQLMDKWFGTPKGLHLDSWLELDIVDGYRVTLSAAKPADAKKLFFVNLGAYGEDFSEAHANIFLVAETEMEAKKRAKAELLKGWPSAVHTDDLYDIDSCIAVGSVGNLYIHLAKTDEKSAHKPVNGYHLVPKGVVEDYMKRHGLADEPNYRASYG